MKEHDVDKLDELNDYRFGTTRHLDWPLSWIIGGALSGIKCPVARKALADAVSGIEIQIPEGETWRFYGDSQTMSINMTQLKFNEKEWDFTMWQNIPCTTIEIGQFVYDDNGKLKFVDCRN